MGVSYFGMERYTDAVATLERARKLAPEHRRVRSYLVAAYGQLGRADSASQHITKLRGLAKTASVPWVLSIGVMDTVIHPYRNEIDTERFREGLRRGGLPEFKEEWALERANRLSGEKLRAISFGRIQHGRHPESGSQFSMKRDEKGRFQASGIWESTGTARVVGGRLCNYWERYELESCAVIYRNPDVDREAPYTIVQRSGVYLLRVESATKMLKN